MSRADVACWPVPSVRRDAGYVRRRVKNGSAQPKLKTTLLTDAVEKGFSGGRTDFFRGTGAVVRK
jgi:hypothetical protein